MRRPTTRRGFARACVAALAATTLVMSAAEASAAISGPDVASYQHPSGSAINWQKVRASGQRFVFIKATEGTRYRNPYFASDWSGSRAAGLIHGAYDFARPNANAGSAARQARYFVATVGKSRHRGDLPPTLDLEVTGGLGPSKLIGWTRQWLNTVQNLTGRKPMIYSYPYFWTHRMAGTRLFRDHRLWGASYGSRPTTFGGAWRTWTFWQYRSTSRVSGIRARADMNRFHGTLTQLRALANMATTTTTSTTTTRAATSSSMSLPSTAAPWSSFTISGRLLRSGHPVAGKTVVVRGRLVGHDSWINVARLTTSSTGRWRITARAPSSAQLQALFFGTATLAPSKTAIRTITIES